MSLETHVQFSAKEGDDFIPKTQKIIFNSDMLGPQGVYIPIFNDECLEEKEEYFTVKLTTEMDCVNLADNEVTITIQDDDCKYIFGRGDLWLN